MRIVSTLLFIFVFGVLPAFAEKVDTPPLSEADVFFGNGTQMSTAVNGTAETKKSENPFAAVVVGEGEADVLEEKNLHQGNGTAPNAPALETVGSSMEIMTIDAYSARRTALQLLKLDVEIAEQRNKLTELEAADRAKTLEIHMAALHKATGLGSPGVSSAYPRESVSGPKAKRVEEVTSTPSVTRKKKVPARPRIISIQGVGNQLTATLSTSTGDLIVRPGDHIGPGAPGIVDKITVDVVRMRNGAETYLLPFKR